MKNPATNPHAKKSTANDTAPNQYPERSADILAFASAFIRVHSATGGLAFPVKVYFGLSTVLTDVEAELRKQAVGGAA